MGSSTFPSPRGGASLMLTFKLANKTTLIIGGNTLAASRAFAALEADSQVVIITPTGREDVCDELRWRAGQGQLSVLDWAGLPGTSTPIDDDIKALESYLKTTKGITLVCVTDTILSAAASQSRPPRTRASASAIYALCRSRNIPANISDMPDLCDFSFAATHRFVDPVSGEGTALQVAVTSNGQGCRLAGRLRREIVSALPKDVGRAVENMGKLRAMAKASASGIPDDAGVESELNEEGGVSTPNRPVPKRSIAETTAEIALRRMKWVAQVSEYWPISQLASMAQDEMHGVLNSGGSDYFAGAVPSDSSEGSRHALALSSTAQKRGRILLVGSGPGHPSLLTLATHAALTKHAHLVLSDKLVPAAVLELIPSEVEVRIARKFPGNAEGAQNEMMEAAVEAAGRGLTVVRLKQGDPVVYGRAGEEVLYFRARGYEPVVIPGVSSALAAPTFAGIPVTQRGVAESFIVCTGVGRAGKEVKLPGYERGRTLIVLMGVARIVQVLSTLTGADANELGRRDGPAFPHNTPIAIIERGSMPDQRVITSTLQHIAAALESVGEQRPPGMIVIGWAVLSLWAKGDMGVLDEGLGRDDARVQNWLGDSKWRLSEGLDEGWEGF
ncbi:hypothetical protein HWV62_22231 [Athelia sp. TMB]|nr:hypothetical protein HWV62_22231 [Athelia sp. TMB]